ncbi:EFG3 [Auxenochlorella protothecoides x Auxenochlorella symbiontica]
MADSWEDQSEEQITYEPQKPKLNPLASSFSFSPGASSFTPVAPAPAPNPAPAPAAAPAPAPEPAELLAADPPSAEVAPAPETSEPPSEPEPKAAPAETRPAPAAPSKAPEAIETVTKELKKATIAAEESEAQKAARRAEVDKVLADITANDARDHLNVVFIGHVDAGKSTTAGQILVLTGGVDERTMEKYEREAKDKKHDSWYIAYIMDTNEEERARGKTVEVGRAFFETPKKRYTILDAPGHKSYVPNMISGAAQADVGVLVISARKGEFETGFERGGQTREHAQLAKTLGVQRLVVVVNKMDDPTTVGEDGVWSRERFEEVEKKLTLFLKGSGYNPKKDLAFLPISGLFGHNIKDRVDPKLCPWYKGPSLFEVLDNVEPALRDVYAPFRMPIMDSYKEMGTVLMGKSEAGIVRVGDSLLVMPTRTQIKVTAIYQDDTEVTAARPGENLKLRVTGVEEDEVSPGFVLCSVHNPVPEVTYFDVQIQVAELLEHKPILSGGYKAILHVHSVTEECEVKTLFFKVNPRTKERTKTKFVKSGDVAIARIATERSICVEKFDVVPQMGRFTLRDEGKTIAIGKIVKLPKARSGEAGEAGEGA